MRWDSQGQLVLLFTVPTVTVCTTAKCLALKGSHISPPHTVKTSFFPPHHLTPPLCVHACMRVCAHSAVHPAVCASALPEAVHLCLELSHLWRSIWSPWRYW